MRGVFEIFFLFSCSTLFSLSCSLFRTCVLVDALGQELEVALVDCPGGLVGLFVFVFFERVFFFE